MEAPLNHLFVDGVSHCKASSYWGSPIYGNPKIYDADLWSLVIFMKWESAHIAIADSFKITILMILDDLEVRTNAGYVMFLWYAILWRKLPWKNILDVFVFVIFAENDVEHVVRCNLNSATYIHMSIYIYMIIPSNKEYGYTQICG